MTAVKTRLRLHLFLQLAAVAAMVAAGLLAVGIPLLASRSLGPRQFLLLVVVAAAVVLGVGALFLVRGVARPLDRLVEAALRLGAEGGLPPLGPPGEDISDGFKVVRLYQGSLHTVILRSARDGFTGRGAPAGPPGGGAPGHAAGGAFIVRLLAASLRQRIARP